jgi:hypothetical protein
MKFIGFMALGARKAKSFCRHLKMGGIAPFLLAQLPGWNPNPACWTIL